MGFLDKLLGRNKPAAGDMAGDAEMGHEGMAQETEGKSEDSPPMQEPAQEAPEHEN